MHNFSWDNKHYSLNTCNINSHRSIHEAAVAAVEIVVAIETATSRLEKACKQYERRQLNRTWSRTNKHILAIKRIKPCHRPIEISTCTYKPECTVHVHVLCISTFIIGWRKGFDTIEYFKI